jgi:hypothetical protein
MFECISMHTLLFGVSHSIYKGYINESKEKKATEWSGFMDYYIFGKYIDILIVLAKN